MDKEGHVSCLECKKLLNGGNNSLYSHYLVKHYYKFQLFFNDYRYVPRKLKIGYKKEFRCDAGPKFKKVYFSIDEAWIEVFLAAIFRGISLYPYQCMGHYKCSRHVRGCHKWHVSQKCYILNP